MHKIDKAKLQQFVEWLGLTKVGKFTSKVDDYLEAVKEAAENFDSIIVKDWIQKASEEGGSGSYTRCQNGIEKARTALAVATVSNRVPIKKTATKEVVKKLKASVRAAKVEKAFRSEMFFAQT